MNYLISLLTFAGPSDKTVQTVHRLGSPKLPVQVVTLVEVDVWENTKATFTFNTKH